MPQITLKNLTNVLTDEDAQTIINILSTVSDAPITLLNKIITQATFDAHNHDSSYVKQNSAQALHPTDAFSIVGNVLYINKADGTNEQIDLSLYLDDTNLSRLVSGVYNAPTQELIFTRDDASTFAIDASMFFDDTNLVLSVDGQTGAVDLSTVYEAIDINIVRKNVSTAFTAVQGATETAGANALDLTGTNCIRFTATAVPITVGTMATKKGQEFSVTIDSSEIATGWGAEFLFAPDFSAVTPTPPTMVGTMEFYMKVVEVNGVDGGIANKIHVAWAQ